MAVVSSRRQAVCGRWLHQEQSGRRSVPRTWRWKAVQGAAVRTIPQRKRILRRARDQFAIPESEKIELDKRTALSTVFFEHQHVTIEMVLNDGAAVYLTLSSFESPDRFINTCATPTNGTRLHPHFRQRHHIRSLRYVCCWRSRRLNTNSKPKDDLAF